jgi:hypothetical protein
MTLATLTVRIEGSVLFADIASPPMNLLGPDLVGDLVEVIQQAAADDTIKVLVFRSTDRVYFIAHVGQVRPEVVSIDQGLGLFERADKRRGGALGVGAIEPVARHCN